MAKFWGFGGGASSPGESSPSTNPFAGGSGGQAEGANALAELQRDRDEWQKRAEAWETEYRSSCGGRLRELQRHHRWHQHPGLERLERALDRNIAWEMAAAKDGHLIQKVAEKHGKVEARYVEVSDHDRLLKWGHPPSTSSMLVGSWHTDKILDLTKVVRIEYAAIRPCPAHPMHAPPWLCFSLHTAERSFEFVCPDEVVVQNFVLACSRLAVNSTGGIHSRRRFHAVKGWSKVIDGCQRRGVPLRRAFLEALLRSSATPADKDSPCGGKSPTRYNVGALASSPRKAAAPATPAAPVILTAKQWPRPNETWVFAAFAAAEVDIYKDAEGTEWVNRMPTRDKDGESRMVTILSATVGQKLIEIRGTDKLRFVKGWMEPVGADGGWILAKKK